MEKRRGTEEVRIKRLLSSSRNKMSKPNVPEGLIATATATFDGFLQLLSFSQVLITKYVET
ncbi:hypothetical protein E2C01_067090 [Portunus trituberculatus]|uniref:Uncharacterized protein n=1 Tax=Portunus trituberculatus TaxID=210409 RepID=A0A5B7HU38_PORTR|nr:hypothetical protein [Portunus trituberculatus]